MKKLRFVDLAVPIKNPNPEEMGLETSNLQPTIVYQTHEETGPLMAKGLNCSLEDLPNGLGAAWETLSLVAHTGTHIDAPYHFYPTVNGKPARTADEVPLDWFYGDGVVLDLRHKKSGEETTIEDLKEALTKINYTIKESDIVCLMFGMDKAYGTREYWTDFPGMSAEAVHWLVDQGVKVIGTDALGFDIPFKNIREKFKKTGDPKTIWQAHRVGMEKEFCDMEKMANLDQLPPFGFKIICFPIPIYRASGAWVRPVAIIEEE